MWPRFGVLVVELLISSSRSLGCENHAGLCLKNAIAHRLLIGSGVEAVANADASIPTYGRRLFYDRQMYAFFFETKGGA